MDKKRKRLSVKKIFIILICIILIIAIAIGVSAYMYVMGKLNKMQQVEIKVEDLQIDEKVEENLENYRNIAIFCVDSRNDELGAGNRSDGIIIASLNNTNNEVNLISVYRDSYLDIEGYGLDKVTHAYSFGSAQLAMATLNRNLDLNIQEFVTVNFDVVVEAVDLLGGVDINIDEEEIGYVNGYINGTNVTTSDEHIKLTHTGYQTLNGIQAVAYSRVRYTAGGDYKRTERMRDVMMAIFEKAKKADPKTIDNFLNNILPDIYTNISAKEILQLAPNAINYKVNTSMGWPYEIRGITLNAWYGVPVTLESNVEKLHEEIFGADEYEMSDTVKEISDRIKNKTGYTE